MLNRIVASFYWIGRYTERIDYTARMADVNIYGHYKLNDQNDYGNSILNCLNYVRNNAREVRHYATNRMWDSINNFYLWLSKQNQEAVKMPFKVLNRVRNEVSLFKNIADSSMLHEVEWRFMHAGEQLERAENTVRMILQVLDSLNEAEEDLQNIDYHRLVSLLESVDGVEAFRKVYANNFSFQKAIEFLLLSSVFSKSTYYSLFALEDNLKGLKIEYQLDQLAKVIRKVNRLRALLYQCLDLKGKSIHEYRGFLNAIIAGCNQVNRDIEESIAYEPETDIKDNFHRKLAELV